MAVTFQPPTPLLREDRRGRKLAPSELEPFTGDEYVPKTIELPEHGGRLGLLTRPMGLEGAGGGEAVAQLLDVRDPDPVPLEVSLRAPEGVGHVSPEAGPTVEAGDLKPVIDSSYPLEQLADAFRHQESQRHFDKICLTVK